MRFAPVRRVLLALFLVVSGCASNVRQGPNDALRAYAKAVKERRVEDAYALLATDAKRNLSLEAFRRMLTENPGEVEEMAQALARATTDPIVTATVTTPQGDEIVLVYDHARWRIDGASLDLYGQGTPRQSIRSFLRAFERKRYDVLMRFVPDVKKVADERYPALDETRLRESWEGPQREEMERITQGIKAALPQATVEETADRAAMAYGATGTLQLVREHGVWKIEDFD
jgi:hypothetical protein